MRLVKGNDLPPRLREEVLREYVYRTLDTTCKNDEIWLAKHAFYVTKAGNLSRSHKRCEPACMADLEGT